MDRTTKTEVLFLKITCYNMKSLCEKTINNNNFKKQLKLTVKHLRPSGILGTHHKKM